MSTPDKEERFGAWQPTPGYDDNEPVVLTDPLLTVSAMQAAVASEAEARRLRRAAQVRAAERLGEVTSEEWEQVNEQAAQNRLALDTCIDRLTSPLVTLFSNEFDRQEKSVPKHPGVLSDIPPLDEDPEGWRKYLARHCWSTTWTAPSRIPYFAAGLPSTPGGKPELIGLVADLSYLGGPKRHTSLYVREGRVVVAHTERGGDTKTFVTGMPDDKNRPPELTGGWGHGRQRTTHTARYNAETDAYDGSPYARDHAVVLGSLAEICGDILPQYKAAFSQAATGFSSSRRQKR